MPRNLPGLTLAVAAVLTALGLLTLPSGMQLRYRSEVIVDSSPGEAWQRLRNLSLAHHYVPGVAHTRIVTSHKEGVGTIRHVYDSEGAYLVETVTDWIDGRGFTLSLSKENGSAPAPFQRATFTYGLAPVGAPGTRVTTELSAVMAGGLLGEWLGRLVLASALQQRVDEIAAGLKVYYEEAPGTGDGR